MTHIYHHQAKFRWTENLTSRFIQLRKENGKLFTGRKYSAQAGWQYILRQMRHEFPTIMADVHYRVLKKKWSNLLQQYKELKNPVHGDKNKADDVSWPFYNAIDAIVVSQINRKSNSHPDDDEDEDIEEDVDPHEFLCVSVSPLDDQVTPLPSPTEEKPQMIQLTRNTLRSGNIKENLTTPENAVSSRKRLRDPLALDTRPSNLNCTANNNCMTTKAKLEISTTTSSIIPKDIAKLRRLEMNQSSLPTQQLQIIRTAANHAKRPPQILGRETKRVRKSIAVGFQRSCNDTTSIGNHDNAIENKLNDFFEYIKQRDEENRLIMLRILHAVEKIAEKYE